MSSMQKKAGVLGSCEFSKIDRFIAKIPFNPNALGICQYLDEVCGIDGVGIPIVICMVFRLRFVEFPLFDQ